MVSLPRYSFTMFFIIIRLRVMSLRVRIFLFSSFMRMNWSNRDSLFYTSRGRCYKLLFLIAFMLSKCLFTIVMSEEKEWLFYLLYLFLGFGYCYTAFGFGFCFLCSGSTTILSFVFFLFSGF